MFAAHHFLVSAPLPLDKVSQNKDRTCGEPVAIFLRRSWMKVGRMCDFAISGTCVATLLREPIAVFYELLRLG